MQVYFSRHWWQVSRDFISYMSRLAVTKGGKNPLYGITILFSRSTWDDLHLWGGDDLDCYDPSPLSLGLGCDDVQEDLESNSIWEVEHVPWRKEQFGSQPSYSHEFPACRGLGSLFLVRSYGRL